MKIKSVLVLIVAGMAMVGPAGAVHLTPKAMDVLVCLAERIDLHLAVGGSFEQ